MHLEPFDDVVHGNARVNFFGKNKGHHFFSIAHSMPHVPLGVSDKFRGKNARAFMVDVIEEIDWSVGANSWTRSSATAGPNTLGLFHLR